MTAVFFFYRHKLSGVNIILRALEILHHHHNILRLIFCSIICLLILTSLISGTHLLHSYAAKSCRILLCMYTHRQIVEFHHSSILFHDLWICFVPSETSVAFPEIQPHLPPELLELYELYQIDAQCANGERDGKLDLQNMLRVSVKCGTD